MLSERAPGPDGTQSLLAGERPAESHEDNTSLLVSSRISNLPGKTVGMQRNVCLSDRNSVLRRVCEVYAPSRTCRDAKIAGEHSGNTVVR